MTRDNPTLKLKKRDFSSGLWIIFIGIQARKKMIKIGGNFDRAFYNNRNFKFILRPLMEL
jgi:hypothetical protein